MADKKKTKSIEKCVIKRKRNPIQDGGAKSPPTCFPPVTSTNVGVSPF